MATSDLATSALQKTNWNGPALPFLAKVGGHYTSKALRQLIYSSLYMILTTPLGTRPWRPEFGSLIPSLVHEPDDEILAATIRVYTVEAVERWEPRIRIVSIDVSIEERSNQISIGLTYLLLATGEQVNEFIALNRNSTLEVVR